MIKIDINLVFTIINLLVLYLLMKKFLFGPIINVMDQRKAMIDQQFAEAKERQDNAKALQEQYEGALKSAKEESYQIMEQARKEAKAQADHTVEETTAKVDAMLAKAQEDITFSIFPLIYYTSKKSLMGKHVNAKWNTFLGYAIAIVLTILNLKLIIDTF